MVSINLYQSGKLNLTLNFPTSWNELFPEEVIFISKQLLKQTEDTAGHIRPQLLKFIIESRARHAGEKLPKAWMTKLDPEDAFLSGNSLLDFIFITNDLTNIPAVLKSGMKRFYPVQFDNITCGEFEDCEFKVNEFFNKPGPDPLASLAAILFRPKQSMALSFWRGVGVRLIRPYITYSAKTDQYTMYDHERYKKYLLKLAPELLYSIFIWYSGCSAQMSTMFPTVYDTNDNGVHDPMAFTNCIHAGAGPKNGSREKIRTMKLYEFMYDMEQEAEKAEQLKQENERISRAR